MNPQLLMAQSALRGNIEEGMAVAQETEGNLHSAASLPPLGSDSVRHTRVLAKAVTGGGLPPFFISPPPFF